MIFIFIIFIGNIDSKILFNKCKRVKINTLTAKEFKSHCTVCKKLEKFFTKYIIMSFIRFNKLVTQERYLYYIIIHLNKSNVIISL